MPAEQACRTVLIGIAENPSQGSHAGLLLSRYLRVAVKSEGASEHDDYRKMKPMLLDAACAASASAKAIYSLAFSRWKEGLPRRAASKELYVQGRAIVGLGADNVIETGLTLHHTYGVPYLPGSALKGLASHYCDQIWGAADEKWTRGAEHHKALFGALDDAGHIAFHDAWITPDSLPTSLARDVMTPHHGDYYSGKTYTSGPEAGKLIPPTDFDDPNPVLFLSVTGTFLVAVSCDVDDEEGHKWASLAMNLLEKALHEWGIGGKTSSGYGRLGGTPRDITQSGASAQVPAAEVPRLAYARGSWIQVTRVEEKGKVKFRADDGLLGQFIGETPPAGDTIEVWVANASPQTYTFTLKEPTVKQKQNRREPGHDRRR